MRRSCIRQHVVLFAISAQHVRQFPGAKLRRDVPSGQVCGEVSGGNSCECVTSDQTCLISQAGACGGACPSGQFCGQVSGGNSCECRCDALCALVTKWGSAGSGDGQFSNPIAVAVDGSGHVFVADSDNVRIQKFTNTGTFLTKW